jgi:hypothetical protein
MNTEVIYLLVELRALCFNRLQFGSQFNVTEAGPLLFVQVVYLTVMRIVTLLPEKVALMEAEPLPTAVILPSFTVATLALDVVHTAALVTSTGVPVV